MTSRERVARAFSHKSPDRVPLDLGGTHDSTLSLVCHRDLARHYQRTWDDYNMYDWANGLVVPDGEMQDFSAWMCAAPAPVAVWSARWRITMSA